MRIHVLSVPAGRGGERPYILHLGARRLALGAVRRLAEEPRGRVFEVEDADGRRFVLRRLAASHWELDAVYRPRARG